MAFMYGPQLWPLESHLIYRAPSQLEITTATKRRHSMARMMSMRCVQLKLVSWLQNYVSDTKRGRPVPDMQVIFPVVAKLLEHCIQT